MKANIKKFKAIIRCNKEDGFTTYSLHVTSTLKAYKDLICFSIKDGVRLEDYPDNQLLDLIKNVNPKLESFKEIGITLQFSSLSKLIIKKDNVNFYKEKLNTHYFEKYKNSLTHRIMWVFFEDNPTLPIRECLNLVYSNIDRIGNLVYSNRLEETDKQRNLLDKI